MAVNPIPPQAYTRDTLLKAYAWLMNQNQSIKEMATTPDILVSLYLKAQRNGEEALDRPSIQNFKNELKSLAGLMGDLGVGSSSPVHTIPQTANPHPNQAPQAQVAASYSSPTNAAGYSSQMNSQPNQTVPSNASESIVRTAPQSATQVINQVHIQVPQNSAYAAQAPSQASDQLFLDAKTRQMLVEVQTQLNLSSEQEALRMLVMLGYNKAKSLLS